MRELKLCEERGSGVDRALDAIEKQALPPPLYATVADSTVVTIYAERTFATMSRAERLRACYQHACLRHQANDFMSNGSLRQRFGMSERQYPQISKVTSEAIDAGLVYPLEDSQGNSSSQTRYVPWWAKPGAPKPAADM